MKEAAGEVESGCVWILSQHRGCEDFHGKAGATWGLAGHWVKTKTKADVFRADLNPGISQGSPLRSMTNTSMSAALLQLLWDQPSQPLQLLCGTLRLQPGIDRGKITQM